MIVITIVYKMSSWMLSQDSWWSSYAEHFSPVPGELPKEENLFKIMLHFFFLDEGHPCAAAHGVRRRHQWQDRLWTQTDFVLRGQNISVEGLTMFLPGGGNVNCLLFLLTVSCLQVETCMSSENIINVSCDIVCKSAACFLFYASMLKMLCGGNSVQRLHITWFVSQQTWLTCKTFRSCLVMICVFYFFTFVMEDIKSPPFYIHLTL